MGTPFRSRLKALGLPHTFWLLWIGTFINRLGGFVVPFLTLYLTSQRGLSIGQAALVVSLFGAGSFSAALVGGELADRLGRRPVMLISFLIAPVNMILLGLARPLTVIGPLTLLQGFFTDLYRPAVNAMVADLVPAEGRPRAYGYIYWAINLGFAFAPAIAGLMARWNYFLLFLGDALTTFVFGMIVLWGVRETRPSRAKEGARTGEEGRLARLGREPLMLVFAALALGFGIIYMQGNVTLPVDMRLHGLGPDAYGLAIAVNGALIVLLGIPASHILTRWPRFASLALSGLLLGIGYGLTAFAASLAVFALTIAVWTLGEIAGATVAPSVVADLSPVDLRGLYQGIYGGAVGLSFFLGPILGGWIFQQFGPRTLWGACFALGCLLALGYLAMSGPAQRRLAKRARAA
ncbi:MAG: MFS transporter [Anaerolineales bacterium]|jgi:MFS family permease